MTPLIGMCMSRAAAGVCAISAEASVCEHDAAG